MKGESKIKWDLRQMSGSPGQLSEKCAQSVVGIVAFWMKTEERGGVGDGDCGMLMIRIRSDEEKARVKVSEWVCLSVCRARRPPSADP